MKITEILVIPEVLNGSMYFRPINTDFLGTALRVSQHIGNSRIEKYLTWCSEPKFPLANISSTYYLMEDYELITPEQLAKEQKELNPDLYITP